MKDETAATSDDADIGKRHKKMAVAAVVLVCVVIVGVVIGVVLGKDEDGGSKSSSSNELDKSLVDLEESSSTPPPSGLLSMIPSDAPSLTPSISPTEKSASPSAAPSDPPSLAPTELFSKPNPVPDDPPPGYFNYDPNDNNYGPDQWHRVDTSQSFLREFDSNGFGPWKGFLAAKDPTNNECDGSDRHQSPKNLVKTEDCEAVHEIRSKCGKIILPDTRIEKLILPHKLSLVMPRRPCLTEDFTDGSCSAGRPPVADYPKFSSTGSPFSDLHHWDLKVPGEHTIEGVSFDAEVQLFHTHLTSDRASSLGIPVRATKEGFNQEMQSILDQFQWVYDKDAMDCSATSPGNNIRRRDTTVSSDLYYYNVSSLNSEQQAGDHHNSEWEANNDNDDEAPRRLQPLKGFDPYSDAFMTTMFFFRYDGSITEPPCMRVTWWVMSEPMIISFEQLKQIKMLLFSHVDGNCQRTSVHNSDQSVARPIQPLGDNREIQQCMEGDFLSDIDQGYDAAKKCS